MAVMSVLLSLGAVLATGVSKAGKFNANVARLSRDGGTSWSTIWEGAITGISVSAANPDAVWVSTTHALHRATNAGRTFSHLPASDTLAKAKAPLRNITVAPSDANRQMLWRQGENYAWDRFYSRDGGRTLSFAGNGVKNVMVGGAPQFSTTNPEVVFFGSQDYATFLSSDGVSNWTYLDKGWGDTPSRNTGGQISRHRSHQPGCDLRGRKSKPLRLERQRAAFGRWRKKVDQPHKEPGVGGRVLGRRSGEHVGARASRDARAMVGHQLLWHLEAFAPVKAACRTDRAGIRSARAVSEPRVRLRSLS